MTVHDLSAGAAINLDAVVPSDFQSRFDAAREAVEIANRNYEQNFPFGYGLIRHYLNLPSGLSDSELIDAARAEWDTVLTKIRNRDFS